MATYVYCPDHPEASENGHVEKSKAQEWNYYNNPDNRAVIGNQVVSLNFISDHMPDTRHMANGKTYSSKAAFRSATKAAGCVEVGNDSSYLDPKPRKPAQLDRGQRRESIRKALYEARNTKP